VEKINNVWKIKEKNRLYIYIHICMYIYMFIQVLTVSIDLQSNDDALWLLGWHFTGEMEQEDYQREREVTCSTCLIRKICSDHL